MPHQQGPAPTADYRVRWQTADGVTEWVGVLLPPRAEEGVLVLRIAPGRLLWIPLATITGPIEIEGA